MLKRLQTYGIPSVSSLLVATGELASQITASKRTADTGVLLLEFALNRPSSKRCRSAVARMNFLHSRYQKAGKIRESDMLYTLSVFALEPVRWVNMYEWRSFTDLELCASGTYWKAMGDAMGISFAKLPSANTGWKDGLHWLEEIKTWSEQYERLNMVPAETNRQLAQSHLDVLFINIPSSLHPIGQHIVAVLVGERIRKAMMLPRPSSVYIGAISALFGVRQVLLRFLALPRPQLFRKSYISAHPNPDTGRYSSKEYLSHPWYVTPTFARRWGFRAWVTRFLGRKLPGDDGNRYLPEGYKIQEVGPRNQIGHGCKAMLENEESLANLGYGGCPFGQVKG